MLAAILAVIDVATPADLWGWVSTSLPASTLVNGLGLGVLATLFATDRIITKGQHARRVADIVDGHNLIVAELREHHALLTGASNRAYDELKESRNYYRDARLAEADRADKVTEKLASGYQEFGKLTTGLLRSIDELAKDAPNA